jgi:putative methionine-R-sulfoxide reductase with GAF domain
MSSSSSPLVSVEKILTDGGDADDILRHVIAALHDDAGYAWAGLFFVEDGALTLGPEAGVPNAERRTSVPVRWQGATVAELAVDAAAPDTAFLERVAELIAGHCLVGWDTGGEPWVS